VNRIDATIEHVMAYCEKRVSTEELVKFEEAKRALARESATQFLDRLLPHPGAAQRVIDRISQLCPQGEDCAKPERTEGRAFQCDHCSYRGCAACVSLHEAAGHVSDSENAEGRYK
jgi:hypothetical protein